MHAATYVYCFGCGIAFLVIALVSSWEPWWAGWILILGLTVPLSVIGVWGIASGAKGLPLIDEAASLPSSELRHIAWFGLVFFAFGMFFAAMAVLDEPISAAEAKLYPPWTEWVFAACSVWVSLGGAGLSLLASRELRNRRRDDCD